VLIDWFTVGAQALNFLVLVWLLKRFLYQPILDAVDARERRIAAELNDAETKQAQASQQRDEFARRNEEIAGQRGALLAQAADEAAIVRQRLLDEARLAAEALTARRRQALALPYLAAIRPYARPYLRMIEAAHEKSTSAG